MGKKEEQGKFVIEGKQKLWNKKIIDWILLTNFTRWTTSFKTKDKKNNILLNPFKSDDVYILQLKFSKMAWKRKRFFLPGSQILCVRFVSRNNG